MAFQQIIGWFFMACALVYAIVIIKNALSDREALRLVPGDLRKIMPAELLVYFLATIGISDFVMNTIVVKQMKLAEADALPDTLITAGIVPPALQSSYTRATTRAEFCALATALYENVLGAISPRAAGRPGRFPRVGSAQFAL